MSDKITTLHLKNDPSTNIYPNVKMENIPLDVTISRDGENLVKTKTIYEFTTSNFLSLMGGTMEGEIKTGDFVGPEKSVLGDGLDVIETSNPANPATHYGCGYIKQDDDEDSSIKYEYHFPKKSGTLALKDDIEQEIETRFIKEDAYHNVFVGTTTFNGTISSNTISYNVALGDLALAKLEHTTGDDARYNTAIGSYALKENTTGNHNTAVGFQCMSANKTGMYNTALGEDALLSSVDGGFNVALGCRAMQNFTTGNYNIAIGTNAMYYGANIPTGTNNIAIGPSAFAAVTTGSYNVIVGGYSRPSSSTDTYSIVIGNSLQGTKNHQCIIGGSAVETICLYIGGKKRELQFNADGSVTWTEI